jgi:hypothetical protein
MSEIINRGTAGIKADFVVGQRLELLHAAGKTVENFHTDIVSNPFHLLNGGQAGYLIVHKHESIWICGLRITIAAGNGLPASSTHSTLLHGPRNFGKEKLKAGELTSQIVQCFSNATLFVYRCEAAT